MHDMSDPHSSNIPTAEILEFCLLNQQHVRILDQLLFWNGQAVALGWVAPLSLEIARSIKTMNLISRRDVDDAMKREFQPLLKAWEYREREVELEDMQLKGRVPRGDPSDSVIELFRPNAAKI